MTGASERITENGFIARWRDRMKARAIKVSRARETKRQHKPSKCEKHMSVKCHSCPVGRQVLRLLRLVL